MGIQMIEIVEMVFWFANIDPEKLTVPVTKTGVLMNAYAGHFLVDFLGSHLEHFNGLHGHITTHYSKDNGMSFSLVIFEFW
jgi:hypothetical protein